MFCQQRTRLIPKWSKRWHKHPRCLKYFSRTPVLITTPRHCGSLRALHPAVAVLSHPSSPSKTQACHRVCILHGQSDTYYSWKLLLPWLINHVTNWRGTIARWHPSYGQWVSLTKRFLFIFLNVASPRQNQMPGIYLHMPGDVRLLTVTVSNFNNHDMLHLLTPQHNNSGELYCQRHYPLTAEWLNSW